MKSSEVKNETKTLSDINVDILWKYSNSVAAAQHIKEKVLGTI